MLPNMGCRDVKALDINANANISRWQIAKGLVKPLAGIIETVKAGNKVIFDQDENGENISRIVNKATQVVIPIEQVAGQYEFDMFVPKEGDLLGAVNESNDDDCWPPVSEDEDEDHDKVKYVGVWSALEDDEEVDMRSTFIGLV